ncbi:hypothetical protein LTR66_012708, partial [Elasticomyces elasticus]
MSTVTVHTTLVETTYTTVYPTPTPSLYVPPYGTTSQSSSLTVTSQAPEIPVGSITPTVANLSSSANTQPTVTPKYSPTPNAGSALAPSGHASWKRNAAVGGSTGVIGGLLLLSILAFFCLRKRRRKQDIEAQRGTSVTRRATPPIIPPLWDEKSTRPTRVKELPLIEDDHLIRIGLDHWERPFAREDPFHDPSRNTPLRITNPDPSRPSTPRPSSGASEKFLHRQRAALAAAFANANRSRSSQTLTLPGQDGTRAHTGQAMAKEIGLLPAAAPPKPPRSSRTSTSSQLLHQLPPEDPFITPPPPPPPPAGAQIPHANP